MAEVAELHLPQDVFDDGEIETLDSFPHWPPFLDHDDLYTYDPDPDPDFDHFSPRPSDFDPSDHSFYAQEIFDCDDETDEEEEGCVEIVGSEGSESEDSVTDLNHFNHQDNHHRQVNFVFDLLDCCEEQTHVVEHGNNNGSVSNLLSDDPGFRLVDENDEMGSNYLELGLGLGLGSGLDRIHGDENDENGGFMIEEFAGEFVMSRRRSQSGESSGLRVVEPFRDGLRAVRIESDSDEEEDGILGIDLHSDDDDGLGGGRDDVDLPLRWDACLRLEDQREPNEEFEWEEVDERVDEREVLSMVIDADEERSVSTEIESDEAMRTLEWQVLLAVNNLERNSELENDADHEDYIYPAEYEMLFGQFAESESSIRGSPPAAQSVVNSLVSVAVSQEDVQNKNAVCAVCKEEISIEEKVKKLPCSHYYHGDCIIPWLNIRNTCPVCRYELPTDDPDYEQMRTQNSGHGNTHTQVRYDFQIFPEN